MDKQTIVDYSKTLEKYGIALCGLLYPSQNETLIKALAFYKKSAQIPHIEDSFTKLAFAMIVADLIWQEKQKGETYHE